METCPFCSPQIYHDERSDVLIENEHCLFISGDESHLEGWGMIIPRAHRETAFDLTQDEWKDTYELLQQVKQSIDNSLKPDGYSIGWNCGKVGGQSVFHAHLHIIPRFADEPYAGRGIRWFMKQDENRRPGFAE